MSSSTPIENPQAWWDELEDQWKLAYSQAVFNQRQLYTPSAEEIQALLTLPVLRFASLDSTNPNMSVDLTNLSGLSQLQQVELLFIQNHPITSLKEISELTQLKQLIASGNQLTSLEGIEKMTQLEKLYVQQNQLTSIAQVSGLTALRELNIFKNPLTRIDGLGAQHEGTLEQLMALPLPELVEGETERIEEVLGISLEVGSRIRRRRF